MIKLFKRHRTLFGLFCLGALIGLILMVTAQGGTSQVSAEKMAYTKAYGVFNQKCTGCHASVADPEKAGKTRDDWHLVVNVMHGHGLDMTAEQSEMIIDLLYDLRRGMEKEAG